MDAGEFQFTYTAFPKDQKSVSYHDNYQKFHILWYEAWKMQNSPTHEMKYLD